MPRPTNGIYDLNPEGVDAARLFLDEVLGVPVPFQCTLPHALEVRPTQFRFWRFKTEQIVVEEGDDFQIESIVQDDTPKPVIELKTKKVTWTDLSADQKKAFEDGFVLVTE